jgi:hypothetical protein
MKLTFATHQKVDIEDSSGIRRGGLFISYSTTSISSSGISRLGLSGGGRHDDAEAEAGRCRWLLLVPWPWLCCAVAALWWT